LLARGDALNNRRAQLVALLVPALLVLGVDHLTKWLVVNHLQLGQVVPEGSRIGLKHVENSGAAFGLFPSLGWFYPIVAVAVAIFIVGYGHRLAPALWQQAVLGIILGGALSNAIDRVLQGHVTDFLYVWFWPVFNIADSSIVVGVIIAIIWFHPPKKANSGPSLNE
jgi:signal peptidase II